VIVVFNSSSSEVVDAMPAQFSYGEPQLHWMMDQSSPVAMGRNKHLYDRDVHLLSVMVKIQ